MQHLTWDELWEFFDEGTSDKARAQHVKQCTVCSRKMESVKLANASITQSLQLTFPEPDRAPFDLPLHLPQPPWSGTQVAQERAKKRVPWWSRPWLLAGSSVIGAAVFGLVIGFHVGSHREAVRHQLASTMTGTGTVASLAPVSNSTHQHEMGNNGVLHPNVAKPQTSQSTTHSASVPVAKTPARVTSDTVARSVPPAPVHNDGTVGIQVVVKDSVGQLVGEAKVAVFRGQRLLANTITQQNGKTPSLGMDDKLGVVIPLHGFVASPEMDKTLTIVIVKPGFQRTVIYEVARPGPAQKTIILTFKLSPSVQAAPFSTLASPVDHNLTQSTDGTAVRIRQNQIVALSATNGVVSADQLSNAKLLATWLADTPAG